MRDFAIYTVCTGHYKYGLFALVNSLLHFGYEGPIIVATDKSIPKLEGVNQVEQVILDSKHIFGNLKARVILENPAKKFIYLDPDVIQLNADFIHIVLDSLDKFGKLILSTEGLVSKNEIRRTIWNDKVKVSTLPQSDQYYSGGFVAGVFEEHKYILELWDKYIHEYIEPGKYFRCCPEFPLADQDILNVVVQNISSDKILSIAIPDWKGTATMFNPFHEFGFYESSLFVHATGKQKTWTLKEIPMRYPNPYDKAFFKFIQMKEFGIKTDYTFTKMQVRWFKESKILPFYNNIRKITRLFFG